MRRLAVLAPVVLLASGCSGNGGGSGPADVPADPAADAAVEAAGDVPADVPAEAFAFHAIRQQPVPVEDEAYAEDYATFYAAPGDARALVVHQGALYAGGPAGLFRFDPAKDAFEKVRDGAIVDVADPDHVVGPEVPGATSIATSAAGTWVGTDTGLLAWDAGTKQYQPVAAATGFAIRDVAADGSKVYLATGQGLGVLEGATLSWQKAADGRLPDDDVLSVSTDGGKVVAGCATGIATVGGASVKAEKGGLPAGDVIALAAGGAILGHARGATV
ncbi:MAG: hypothetical protein FJ087_16775, partial [Deltaproteobacteria bacterium]|nr:hypothetical protein [Deltaproteobacteria bacterium]